MPPPGHPLFAQWKERCLQFGPGTPLALVELLRRGHEANYEVLLALRAWGWEAWGEPKDGHWTFVVRTRLTDEWTVLVPDPPLPVGGSS
jgi:hypothetical protein